MKKIKNCVIADDEQIARAIIASYIEQVPNLCLLKECKDAFEAMEALEEGNVDLLFLDINMPKLNGLGMLRTIRNPPDVIITTAYSEYAVEGFELEVTDYLLKPFSFERFVQAVRKTTKSSQPETTVRPSTSLVDYIFVKSDQKTVRLDLNEIRYIEAYGNYIFIYHGASERIMVKQTLIQFENQLPEQMFLQIHKSYIVAVARIDFLEGNEISINGKRLPVGKAYKSQLVEAVGRRVKG